MLPDVDERVRQPWRVDGVDFGGRAFDNPRRKDLPHDLPLGERANAVVPTATNKEMKDGELVMIGIAPRFNGYAGTFGDTLPVNGVFTQDQRDAMNHLREVMWLTKGMLKPGVSGKEIALIVV